jgi:hypothetical protein
MAGDKADIQTPAQQMELDFWGTLDGTRVVSTTAGTSLVPWRAPTKAEVAKAFGDADATKKGNSRVMRLSQIHRKVRRL